MKKNIHVTMPCIMLKQGRRFIAYAPLLDISTSGATEKKAKERFRELVDVYLEELVAMGTLEEVLGEMGWKKRSGSKWDAPSVTCVTSVHTSLVGANGVGYAQNHSSTLA